MCGFKKFVSFLGACLSSVECRSFSLKLKLDKDMWMGSPVPGTWSVTHLSPPFDL